MSLTGSSTSVYPSATNTDEYHMWRIVKPTLYVDNYYDHAFESRYSSSFNCYYTAQDIVVQKFKNIFNLDLINTNTKIASSGDICVYRNYGDMTLNTLSAPCISHTNNSCKTTTSLRDRLIDTKGPGNATKVVALWTGYLDNDKSRSNSVSANYSIIITPYATTYWSDTDQLYINLSNNDIIKEYSFSYMHELSHQLSLPDHYCYGKKDGNEYCSNEFCDECAGRIRPDCMMSYRFDVRERSESTIYCDECLEKIRVHLLDHHMIGG